jgi:hypothetical protein
VRHTFCNATNSWRDERYITSNPFAGIKYEHPLKQIHGTTRHGREPCVELLLGELRKGPHVSAGVITSEESKARVIRWAYQLLDQEWRGDARKHNGEHLWDATIQVLNLINQDNHMLHAWTKYQRSKERHYINFELVWFCYTSPSRFTCLIMNLYITYYFSMKLVLGSSTKWNNRLPKKQGNGNEILNCQVANIPRLLASADQHNPFQEIKAPVSPSHRRCSLLTTYR